MDSAPWYQSLFGEDYLRVWSFCDLRRAHGAGGGGHHAPAGPAAGQRGPGPLLRLRAPPIPLARHGYRVDRTDLSEVSWNEPASARNGRGCEVTWVRGDMRHVPFEEPVRRRHQPLHRLRLLRARGGGPGGAPAGPEGAAARRPLPHRLHPPGRDAPPASGPPTSPRHGGRPAGG